MRWKGRKRCDHVDSRLPQEAGRYVAPASFTPGISAQRARWFRKGDESGSLRDGRVITA